MRVLFVTSELEPVSKVGGLGDVSGSLPRALKGLGHDVWVMTPRYGVVTGADVGSEHTGVSFELPMDGGRHRVELIRARLHGVTTLFVANDTYFSRPGVYGVDGRDYDDNTFRFALFSRAVSLASRRLGLSPDVVHVNDWQTSLVPVYRRFVDVDRADTAPTVLTIHNLAYQGLAPPALLPRLGLPPELLTIEGLEFYGQVSFLKGGLVTAERVTTVSPRYATEIRTKEHGAGLEGVLESRAGRLTGILNGIDRDLWNPAADGALRAAFDAARPTGKAVNKRALQEELGLAVSDSTPLLAAIGRLDRQKGFDILHEATSRILRGGRAQLVVLGSGNEEMLARFRSMAQRFPKALSVNRGFQDALGRRIYAGADLFLMPSRYEPCGLGQMIALRYGTLPVVHATGGLADTVRDLDEDPEGGNGFTFVDPSAEALTAAVERAVARYRDRGRWSRWVRRALRLDFSWDHSARLYEEVYRSAS